MLKTLLLLLMAAFALGGCDVFEDNDDEVAGPVDPGPDPDPDPDPDPTGDNFNDFVIDLVQDNTADDTDPVEINDLDFEFDEEEDPAAFDELFPPAP